MGLFFLFLDATLGSFSSTEELILKQPGLDLFPMSSTSNAEDDHVLPASKTYYVKLFFLFHFRINIAIK